MSKRARTRAIRAQMAETGENYTRAATQVGARAEVDPAREHVRRVLEQGYEHDLVELRGYEEHERAGRRIVDMGQDGPDSWAVHDWRTGELLARGEGDFDDFDAALERLDPDNVWVDRDGLFSDHVFDIVQTPGVPHSLAQALQEWVDGRNVTDDEIAQFVGWTTDKVHQLRNALS